jgi:phosphate acetyltransferase
MKVLERFLQQAKRNPRKVVLPEGGDPRIIAAARDMKDAGIADPIVLGNPIQIKEAAERAKCDLNGIEAIDPKENDRLDDYLSAYIERRDIKESVAARLLRKPLVHGGMMVACDDAAAMVAGVTSATASVIQAGAVTVGLAPGIETVSSFFLMVFPEFRGKDERTLVFADCAVNIAPTPTQLADITLASVSTARRLLTEPPRVALLSFSTKGSAAHELVDNVTTALDLVKQRDARAPVDGELQLDAALVPEVAAKKLSAASEIAGHANVLIFPDLNAGNIGYKLAQHLAGAQAIGPILQGFAKPLSDLSRGASVDDIVATTAIVMAMAP